MQTAFDFRSPGCHGLRVVLCAHACCGDRHCQLRSETGVVAERLPIKSDRLTTPTSKTRSDARTLKGAMNTKLMQIFAHCPAESCAIGEYAAVEFQLPWPLCSTHSSCLAGKGARSSPRKLLCKMFYFCHCAAVKTGTQTTGSTCSKTVQKFREKRSALFG